jgi:hypothetical protein
MSGTDRRVAASSNSVEETLFNLGLPPNRKEGQQGFRVYETEGKLSKPRTAGSDGHPLAGD